MKITPDDKASGESFLRVGGSKGWLKVAAKLSDLAGNPRGRLTTLGFSGKAAYLEIASSSENTSEFDRVITSGFFSAVYQEGGRLWIDGSATALWKNDKRINPTKWEKLELGYQTILVTALLGIFGIIWHRLQLYLSHNAAVVWPRQHR